MTTVVAIGDSIAFGVGESVATNPGPAWAGRLAHLINAQQHQRFAWPGARIQDLQTLQLPAALMTQPEVVLVSIGGNDAVRHGFHANEFTDRLATSLAQLDQYCKNVVVINLPDVAKTCPIPNSVRAVLRKRILRLNSCIETARLESRATLLDRWSDEATYEDSHLSVDGVHPSPLGYQRLAELSVEALKLATHNEPLTIESDPEQSKFWVATKGVPWAIKRSTRLVPGLVSMIRQESGTGGHPWPTEPWRRTNKA